MKKNTEAKKPATKKAAKAAPAKNAAPARVTFKWRSVFDILSDAETNKDGTRETFHLVEKQGDASVVDLSIFPSDNAFDAGVLDIMGFSIRVRIMSSSKGMFISFPSRKGKTADGAEKWFDEVTCFDKNFHTMIRDLLAAYYEDAGNEEA